jgi:hypothetical protein
MFGISKKFIADMYGEIEVIKLKLNFRDSNINYLERRLRQCESDLGKAVEFFESKHKQEMEIINAILDQLNLKVEVVPEQPEKVIIVQKSDEVKDE